MHATTIVGYVYAADTYCPACIIPTLEGDGIASATARIDAAEGRVDVEELLAQLADAQGIDNQDEHSYDSDEFPKVIFASSIHDTCEPDYCTDRCGACGEPLGYECPAKEDDE